MTKTLIAVPMKDPSVSKTRLEATLPHTARMRLVRLLYRRTLEFLRPVAEAHGAGIAVVTGSQSVAALAQTCDVRVIREPEYSGLNAALTHVARLASEEEYQRLCIIPADLAAPAPEDVHALLQSQTDVTLCPSTDDGTNALLLSPPEAIRFRYGPGSAHLHIRHAEAEGLTTSLLPLESLSFDIDTSSCLSRAIRSVPEIERACA